MWSAELLTLNYLARILLQTYQADFICFGKIILELKTVAALADEHRAQLLNYLHATGFELGLLINFGHHPQLEFERTAKSKQIRADVSDISF
jgi:GxxExxY protein